MVEELTTLDEDIELTSICGNGTYEIRAFKNGQGEVARNKWYYTQYLVIFKSLWENYLTQREKPKLLGYTLTDQGLVDETLHLLAPNGFFFPDNKSPLLKEREEFVYWLKAHSEKITGIIDKEEFNRFDRELESILRINLERKQKFKH